MDQNVKVSKTQEVLFEGTKIPLHDVPLGLPKDVKSLCPRCAKVIDARILEENNKVVMKKKCREHGSFEDVVYSDVELYLKAERWSFEDGEGTRNAFIKNATMCPEQCGLCDMHKSYGCLTNIDLTNRCNLRCSICFANATCAGYVYELSLEQVKMMLQKTKEANEPMDDFVIQFSGGEPTIHPEFLECVKLAKELGSTHVQIATNGITLSDLEFAKKCKEAGLDAAYLQFDGVNEKAYSGTRGVEIFEIKKKAIENCRKTGISVTLVPTIVNGYNDDQVGEIFKFAVENADIIPGISYQPVVFTGRFSEEQRRKQRFTLSDLAHRFEEQTGYAVARKHWYPLTITSPFSKLLSVLRNKNVMRMSCHSNCGLGTYFVVNTKTKQVMPVPEFVDIEGLMIEINEMFFDKNINGGRISKYIAAFKVYNLVKKYFDKEKSPISLKEFLVLVTGIGRTKQEIEWRLMFAAGMHFQDRYNYNVDRVKRCVIHYAAPNGLIYPFCAYNSGPVFRRMIEKKYSVSIEDWVKRNGGEYITEGFFRGELKC